jgi:glycosyltransferase involved in cell wall biosynthesis
MVPSKTGGSAVKVLHVLPSVEQDRGGPARSVTQLVAALKNAGIDARIAARGAPDVALRHFPIPGEIPDGASFKALAAAIASSDVVEIHSMWNGTVSSAAALCRHYRVPYILTPRGMLDPICLQKRRVGKVIYGRSFDRRTVTGAAGFHFLSHDELERAILPPAAAHGRRIVSPNGVAPPPALRGGYLRRVLPPIGNRRVLLHLGRIDAIKGIDLQISALAKIPESQRPVLVLVGPEFGQGDALRRHADRLGVSDWVVWGAPQYGPERYELLAEADLVALTSVYDCNPVAIAEALSVGAAVVATTGCGLDALGREGIVCVVPRTSSAYAGAVQRLLADDKTRQALRGAGREYAQDLSWSKVAEPLIELYERVVHSSTLALAQ